MTTRQARAPHSQPFGAEAFEVGEATVLRWLGMAGFLINARGTTMMIDPLLGDFDMPVMFDFPVTVEAVPRLEAVLVTAQRQRPLICSRVCQEGMGGPVASLVARRPARSFLCGVFVFGWRVLATRGQG